MKKLELLCRKGHTICPFVPHVQSLNCTGESRKQLKAWIELTQKRRGGNRISKGVYFFSRRTTFTSQRNKKITYAGIWEAVLSNREFIFGINALTFTCWLDKILQSKIKFIAYLLPVIEIMSPYPFLPSVGKENDLFRKLLFVFSSPSCLHCFYLTLCFAFPLLLLLYLACFNSFAHLPPDFLWLTPNSCLSSTLKVLHPA